MRLNKRLTRLLGLFLSLVSINSLQAAELLKVGDSAPNFELTDQNGQQITLASNQGKWVVLYFYPKNDTPGCTTEACSFRDNINNLIAQEAVVLGVSLDSLASHQAFAKKYKLPFSLLSDESGEVTNSYNALIDFKLLKFAKRHSFIIDPDGKIARIYRDVDPELHVKEVLDDLRQLQAKG